MVWKDGALLEASIDQGNIVCVAAVLMQQSDIDSRSCFLGQGTLGAYVSMQ